MPPMRRESSHRSASHRWVPCVKKRSQTILRRRSRPCCPPCPPPLWFPPAKLQPPYLHQTTTNTTTIITTFGQRQASLPSTTTVCGILLAMIRFSPTLSWGIPFYTGRNWAGFAPQTTSCKILDGLTLREFSGRDLWRSWLMWRTEAGGGEGMRESPNKGGNKGKRGKEGLIQSQQFQEQKEASSLQ